MTVLSSANEATPCAAVTRTAAQAAVITKALADAEHYRRDSAAAWCAYCAAAQNGACPDHVAYLAPANAYRELAAELAHVLTKTAGRDVPAPRPASDLSRLGQERTMANTTTAASPQLPAVTCTRAFAGRPESVSAARSWVAGFFPVPAAAADAALMTSELFTNTILHSASRLPGGQVTVSVRTGEDTVRVDIVDQGELPPCFPRCPGLGQGLALVVALADVFGADGSDRWFALRTGGAW
jgi:hypothetical protein